MVYTGRPDIAVKKEKSFIQLVSKDLNSIESQKCRNTAKKRSLSKLHTYVTSEETAAQPNHINLHNSA